MPGDDASARRAAAGLQEPATDYGCDDTLLTQPVRPLVVDAGLRGAAASQAEAPGWQGVWVTLTPPALRSAGSPWGVIWKAARRAVQAVRLASVDALNTLCAWADSNC